MTFALAEPNDLPKQKTQIDFHGLVLKKAEQRLPVLIQQKLDRLLR